MIDLETNKIRFKIIDRDILIISIKDIGFYFLTKGLLTERQAYSYIWDLEHDHIKKLNSGYRSGHIFNPIFEVHYEKGRNNMYVSWTYFLQSKKLLPKSKQNNERINKILHLCDMRENILRNKNLFKQAL